MKKNILAAFLFAGFIALNAAPPAGQWKSMNWKNTAVSYEKGTLNLEIKQAQKFHGGAVLAILKPEPDKTFVYSAEVTSREPEVAYLSVKLYKGKKEIQRINSPMNPSEKPAVLSDIFSYIAEVEMRHLEILGNMIRDLGGAPKYQSDRRSPFCAVGIEYDTNPDSLLAAAQKGERNAIMTYRKIAGQIQDECIRKTLERIIMDEEHHEKIFKELMSDMT